MYYLKLIWTFFRIGILNEMAYRVNFYVQLLQSLLSLGTAIAGLAIVFSHTDTLGGWQAVDILLLLGVFMFVGGVIGMVISPSMSQLMDDVRRGIFDYTLTQTLRRAIPRQHLANPLMADHRYSTRRGRAHCRSDLSGPRYWSA